MVTYSISVNYSEAERGEITMEEWKKNTGYWWRWFLSNCKEWVHYSKGTGVDKCDYPVVSCYVQEDDSRIIACFTVAVDFIITKYFREGSNNYQWCNYQRREKTLA